MGSDWFLSQRCDRKEKKVFAVYDSHLKRRVSKLFQLQRCVQPAKAAAENEDTSFLRHNHLSRMRQIAYSTLGNLRNDNRASPASGPSNPQQLEVFWQKLQKLLWVPGFFRSKEASRCWLRCEIKVWRESMARSGQKNS